MSLKEGNAAEKRTIIPQKDLPWCGLEKALQVANVLWDQFAGKSAQPLQVALALELSPTSSNWKYLSGASVAYGLTEGGYNAKEIKLTPLGKSIVAPEDEGETESALLEAVVQPKYLSAFFEKYNNAKLPLKSIAENVLVGMGVPKEKASNTYELIIENGKFAGCFQETKVGTYINLTPNLGDSKRISKEVASHDDSLVVREEPSEELLYEQFARKVSTPVVQTTKEDATKALNTKVFISHGKNKDVVEQLKEIIKFGKYDPVVSVENETLSKPVPDKVLDDMRSCFAGIINVHSEGEFLDSQGSKHIKINDNVLIEIGAAMAFYGQNFILLVQKGVKLPSNLQGLYRCEYEGEKLDYEATMKLLKAFNQFKQ
ncbi:nucleotide-binding protein [Brevibacillus sp. RS1.1]|uniref:TIR domain-containing protein n=1 Tax=Brevibacillus sp. RS1.1 TaxID=2738982 RepID=UPI00156B10D3|nr:TIR domain-containing protein [Brevibacillus sp. RS1.1]NRR05925.1 nucleotide-binding protein [Brevibacillus sp. RS1.1]